MYSQHSQPVLTNNEARGQLHPPGQQQFKPKHNKGVHTTQMKDTLKHPALVTRERGLHNQAPQDILYIKPLFLRSRDVADLHNT